MADEWWRPQNLKRSEAEYAAKTDISTLDTRNDFAFYKVMLQTGDAERSNIGSHNDIDPRMRVDMVTRLLGDGSSVAKIMDVGCGLGFTTNALKQAYPQARVIGVDISSDAIQFAAKRFPGCEFATKVVGPNSDELEAGNDLIFAFEFYPFTRTDDADNHRDYLELLLGKLAPGGKLVVYQDWLNPNSLSSTLAALKPGFNEHRFDEHEIPFRLVARYIGNNPVSRLVSRLLRAAVKFLHGQAMGMNKAIVVYRK